MMETTPVSPETSTIQEDEASEFWFLVSFYIIVYL